MILGQQTQFGWFCDGLTWEMSCSYALVTVVFTGKAFSMMLLELAVGDSVKFFPFDLLDVAIPD